MYFIRGKSLAQLNQLNAQVTKKITHGASQGIDVAYWEGLAAELTTYRAKISLKEAHEDLEDRIKEAKKEKKESQDAQDKEDFKAPAPAAPEYVKKDKTETPKVMLEKRSFAEIEEEKRNKKLEEDCMEMYDDKCYTPPLIDKAPPGMI